MLHESLLAVGAVLAAVLFGRSSRQAASSNAAELPDREPFTGPLVSRLGDALRLARQTVDDHGLRADAHMLATMAYIESTLEPRAVGDHGRSLGLMQILDTTARDLHDRLHYTALGPPTRENLFQPATSIYYAAALLTWLQTHHRWRPGEEWLVRAYNGGAGWETAGEKSLARTLNHWRKYRDAKRKLFGLVAA